MDQSQVESDIDINPEKQFKLEVYKRYENTNLIERFRIYDMKRKQFINRNSFFERKVADFDIVILSMW